jgi:hypothetical protein
MTTLIAVYNSEGCVGRCDARCYNATGLTCTCICGGANHGAGYDRAVMNTVEMAEQLMEDAGFSEQLDAFKQAHGLKGDDYAVEVPNLQPTLPGLGG